MDNLNLRSLCNCVEYFIGLIQVQALTGVDAVYRYKICKHSATDSKYLVSYEILNSNYSLAMTDLGALVANLNTNKSYYRAL